MKYLWCPLFFLLAAATSFALPVGDPRTPDAEVLERIDVPIEQGIHELSLHTFMGASKIDYPDVGGTSLSPGFGAAITYNFFLLPKWSFLVGGGIQLFNNRGTTIEKDFEGFLPNQNDFPDNGTDPVRLYYQAYDYSETQWSLMFMIPVMLQYQTNATRNKAFYYALGAKIGMPFAGAYEGTAGSMKVCGYYPGRWGETEEKSFKFCQDNGFGEGFEDLGFGNYGEITSYSKLKLSTAFFAAAEAGVKWRLYNKLAVYTGFWLDWALNDVAIRSVTDQPFTWTPTKGYSEDHLTPKADIDFRSRTNGKAIPMSFGFTVRFSFGAGSFNAVPDSVRWIREIEYRDSLLREAEYRTACMIEDSIKAQDSIDFYHAKVDVLEDELVEVRNACKVEFAPDLDSIADALKRQRQAERDAVLAAEAAARAAVEAQRQKDLEAAKAARLANFKKSLAFAVNGLDDYKVTQTVPSDRAREKLDTLANLLKDYPNLRVRITGHTCNLGTHEGNVRFGMQRAESGRNYLVGTKGINQSRIEVDSKAEVEPAVPNTNEANRRKNRRITIDVIEGANSSDASSLKEETK